MTQPLFHQILSLSLAALLTAGMLSGMAGLADQQHRSALMAMSDQSMPRQLPDAAVSSARLQAQNTRGALSRPRS